MTAKGNPRLIEREHRIVDHESHWTRFGTTVAEVCACGAVRARLVYDGGSVATPWSGPCWMKSAAGA